MSYSDYETVENHNMMGNIPCDPHSAFQGRIVDTGALTAELDPTLYNLYVNATEGIICEALMIACPDFEIQFCCEGQYLSEK